MLGKQWQQLDHMQIIHVSLQTDNDASLSTFSFYGPDALPDAQQCQSTEGNGMLSAGLLTSFKLQACGHKLVAVYPQLLAECTPKPTVNGKNCMYVC